MNLKRITVDDILKTFDEQQFPLVWAYIGPKADPSRKDLYKRQNWFLIEENENIAGIVCLTDDRFFEKSLHISVLEMLAKNLGLGTKFFEWLKLTFKNKKSSLSLFAKNARVLNWYKRLGFKETGLYGSLLILELAN